MSFYSEVKDVIARKQHRCTNCGEPIMVGEIYKRWVSVEDGWFTSKMHKECLQSLIDESDGEFEYTPYNGERPKP